MDPWLWNYRNYRRKVKELLFYRSELEFQEEVLKTVHPEFEKYYREYCATKGIDIDLLNKNKSTQVDEQLNTASEKKEKIFNKSKKIKKQTNKAFEKIYREIAKKVHPDKLARRLPTPEVVEKEAMFKKAASAMKQKDWGNLLEVAEKLEIKPRNFDGLETEIVKEIRKIKALIANNEKMYSWAFYKSETKEEKDQVVKNFLLQLFGYIVDKND